MSYQGIRITPELSERVQEAVGLRARRQETLGELVGAIASRKGSAPARRPHLRRADLP